MSITERDDIRTIMMMIIMTMIMIMTYLCGNSSCDTTYHDNDDNENDNDHDLPV